MSKALAATCEAGVVSVGGVNIDGVIILSQGTKSSSGVMFMQGGDLYYVASNATELNTLIDKVQDVLAKIETALTGLDGATNSPGAQTANIAQITTVKTAILAMKDNLK